MQHEEKKDIDISIVIPIYNGEKYIKRCMDSLVPQIDDTAEIILVNDGSKDRSEFICTEYSEKISQVKFISQKNKGEAGARNVGMSMCRGKWITFIDVDDFVSDDYFSILKKYMDLSNDCIIFQMMRYDDNGKDLLTSSFLKQKKVNKYVYDEMDRDSFIKRLFLENSEMIHGENFRLRSVWGRLFRREFVEENKLQFPLGVKMGPDMIFMIYVCSCMKKITFVTYPIYYYYQNENSITNCYKPHYENYIKAYAEGIRNWLVEHQEYEIYFMNYCLNDLIFLCKYDFFHKDNHNGDSQKRYKEIIVNGEYSNYYVKAKKYGLLRKYSLSKRIYFWIGKNGWYYLLKFLTYTKYLNA